MAKKIYIGAMIEDLKTTLDTVVSTLAAHTTALGNINTAVAQSVSEINVKDGTTNNIPITTAEKSVTGSTYVSIVKFSVRCNGVIKISGQAKNSIDGKKLIVGNIKNGAAIVESYNSAMTTAYAAFSFNMTVKANDVIELQIKSDNVSAVVTIKEGLLVSYDSLDLINEGAVSIV